ncbi:hypothetical protein JTE90_017541 [Oedothorax gibbosus]|uniref:Structural maintenance of chromosomes protein n=1 Tax=Oedothorax gibbosus TaxID=931172 RepID=A0AAV6TYB7_9ARAC|nr:hypothetical protein JTE90_017541 [Oedothorax gibbosus]
MTANDEQLVELGFAKEEDGSLRFDELVIPPPPMPAMCNEAPSTRLIITKLLVRNFKSYAGEQEVGPFNKNFTAVVGPNGSGKSNVIDSLMFVFGRKSKDIRAKKVTALIHKSAECPNCTSCTVTVNFAMVEDKTGIIDEESRFSVSRTVQEDGTSYYQICNRRVQYKEVARTLRAYGIDLEYNRFLILQGEIESIALMPPKATAKESNGMLEYIEDIVGSQRLIEPINYFQAKADTLKEQENEKVVSVELFEKEMKELEGPKNKAISYLRMRNKSILCENSIMQVQSAHAAIMEKVKKYDQEFNELVREDTANLQNIKNTKGKIQSHKKELEDAEKEINRLNKQYNIFQSETIELEKKKEIYQDEKDIQEEKATEVMGTLKQESNAMQEQKDGLEKELRILKTNCDDIRGEMDLLKKELKIYESGDKKERAKLADIQYDLQKNLELCEKEEGLIKEETAQIKEIETQRATFQDELVEAKEKEASLTQQMIEARQKYEEARSSQMSTRNQSKIMAGLLEGKKNGSLPAQGIYGRLGDLGAISGKYDIAISTACKSLDNIVTDTDVTAKRCLRYLKEHNLGSMTFIMLDKIEHLRTEMNKKKQFPQGAERLFDHIKINDERFRIAFYFALRDTLVTDTLKKANEIGFGTPRYRVVTLDGKVVETSGAMSGGGNSFCRGKIGQKVVENTYTREELIKMNEKVEALTRDLYSVKELCVALSEKIDQRSKKLYSLQVSLKKRTSNMNSYRQNIEINRAQVSKQEEKVSQSSIDENKVTELEEKIKAKNQIYKKAHEETSGVENKVKKLQADILKLTKGKYNKAGEKVNEITTKLAEINYAITKSAANMKQSKAKVTKLESKVEVLQVGLAESEKQLLVLKEKRDAITEKGQKAKELKDQHEEETLEFVKKQKELKKEMAVFSEKEHKLKQAEIELKNSMKKCEANEGEKQAYIRGLNAKIAKLKLEKVEDDPTEIPTLSEEVIEQLNIRNLQADLDILKVQIEDNKQDLSVITEYEKKNQKYKANYDELMILRNDRFLQEKRKLELYKKRLTEFMKAFMEIRGKVKEIYMMLTAEGGDAALDLVNDHDPFAGGIIYSVRPPKKAWKNMCHLSGGEKTLSSLALVFALHYYRTTPFYVMDEIDAALDERNVGIIGKYIMVNQKDAQFIIVSLRSTMNELPEQLLGVFKVDNCTRQLSLCNVQKWAKKKKEEPHTQVEVEHEPLEEEHESLEEEQEQPEEEQELPEGQESPEVER